MGLSAVSNPPDSPLSGVPVACRDRLRATGADEVADLVLSEYLVGRCNNLHSRAVTFRAESAHCVLPVVIEVDGKQLRHMGYADDRDQQDVGDNTEREEVAGPPARDGNPVPKSAHKTPSLLGRLDLKPAFRRLALERRAELPTLTATESTALCSLTQREPSQRPDAASCRPKLPS